MLYRYSVIRQDLAYLNVVTDLLKQFKMGAGRCPVARLSGPPGLGGAQIRFHFPAQHAQSFLQ
ncbi:hypothetical protein PspLS_08852 [Pyricularia sp. CBS 133598]|nr:hypothetical protein PspLS_08852 [Pyricularia sp. CBS 133598]